MTQMLLFDAPTGMADAAVVSVSESVSGKSVVGLQGDSPAAQLQGDSGLQHMGDLARLVLLRYDLMAKRRAQIAARRAK